MTSWSYKYDIAPAICDVLSSRHYTSVIISINRLTFSAERAGPSHLTLPSFAAALTDCHQAHILAPCICHHLSSCIFLDIVRCTDDVMLCACYSLWLNCCSCLYRWTLSVRPFLINFISKIHITTKKLMIIWSAYGGVLVCPAENFSICTFAYLFLYNDLISRNICSGSID